MTVDCPRCAANRRRSTLHATGRLFTSRRGLLRAWLKCDACGFVFSSGLKEALDAASAERGDCEMTPEPNVLSAPVPVPQPTLPMEVAPASKQGFVTPGQLAKHTQYARFLDKVRSQGGE